MKTIIFSSFLLFSVFLSAQFLTPVIDSIPTRDGKMLAADIYLPDTSSAQTYPTILIQTPYNRYFYQWGLPMIDTSLTNSPYAFVVVDWRCFYGSALACDGNYDRGLDGYDIVEWIASHTWSDGQIGTWGPSALGKIQFMTAKYDPPHLVCCVPLVAAPQMNYEVYFPGGSAREEFIEQLDALGYGMSPLLYANTHYNILWSFTEASTFYPDSINVPMLMIGGWYDHNPDVMLDLFNGLQTSSHVSVRDQHKIMMGPWAHGGNGTAYVGSEIQGELSYPAAAGWQDSLAIRFFAYYLLGEANSYDTLSTWMYFQMGEDEWRASDQWPESVYADMNLYLHSSNLLMTDIPALANDSLAFDYDPRDPSPTIGGPTLRLDLEQGPYDQSPIVESRSDVLVFTSPELSFDVSMQGFPKVILYISSDRKDTDFAVRLTDVYPDGRSMILLDGIKRVRFRNGFQISDTSFMQTGLVYEVEIEMYPSSHTFLAGHKIRLDVSSANYPRFNANMNDGNTMYVEGDTLIAHNIVYCSSTYASRLILPLLAYPSGIENEKLTKLKVYPNPFTDYFKLEIPTECHGKKVQLEIVDMNGKILFKQEFEAKEFIMLKPNILEPANYMLSLRCGNEIFKTVLMKN